MTGRYWISSNTGVRRTTAPGRDGQVHADLERVRLDHGRHPGRDRHVGEEVPQPPQGAAAAGVDGGLGGRRVQQRVVARGQRVDQVGQHEADAFGVFLVQARLGHEALRGLRGGQVRLHRAAQQRVARPSRVGEPAVAPGRLHLGAAHGDAGQFAQQLASPPGDQPRPGASAAARRRPEPPGFTRRSMPVAASVSSRSKGAAVASAAAVLIVSLSALIISRPLAERRRRRGSGAWSLVTNLELRMVLRTQARHPLDSVSAGPR